MVWWWKKLSDRKDAGHRLAGKLGAYKGRPEVVVLGVTKGGVVVAFEVAQALGVPLDVLVARRVSLPGYERVTMGAVAAGGVRVLNAEVIRSLPETALEAQVGVEARAVERGEMEYRGGLAPLELASKTAIVVNDELMEPWLMQAALARLLALGPAQVVVAVPVAAAEAAEQVRAKVSALVVLRQAKKVEDPATWYKRWEETSDETVRRIMTYHGRRRGPVAGRG